VRTHEWRHIARRHLLASCPIRCCCLVVGWCCMRRCRSCGGMSESRAEPPRPCAVMQGQRRGRRRRAHTAPTTAPIAPFVTHRRRDRGKKLARDARRAQSDAARPSVGGRDGREEGGKGGKVRSEARDEEGRTRGRREEGRGGGWVSAQCVCVCGA
jgi:hypothetical protein